MMQTVFLNNVSEGSHRKFNWMGLSLSYAIGIFYYDDLKVISNRIKLAQCFVLNAILFFLFLKYIYIYI